MKISKITLENVKCFSKEVFSLNKEDTDDPLSVCALVGANGSGKSTILKAVVAAFTTLNSDYAGEILDNDMVYYDQSLATVALTLNFNDRERKALDIDKNHEHLGYAHIIDNEEPEGYNILFVSNELDENSIKEYSGFLERLNTNDRIGLIMYYDPFRFVSQKNPAGPNIKIQENAKTHALLSNINIDGRNLYRDLELKQWVVNMDYIRLKEPTERNLSIYNHIIKAFDLLLYPLKFETINQSGCLVFTNVKDNHKTTIDMLSDGFKSIFSIVLDIIKRMALASDFPNEEFYMKEAIVLIDEIDCHIHPKWQKKLMPAFRELFPNCQFIITTHSPYILDSLQAYEIRKVGEKEIV